MAVQAAPLSETSSIAGFQRYHAFDSLRAAMMLLGLVIHSAMGYVIFPTDRTWPFKDPHPSAFFDLLVMFIHAFRMPVFFVIAGFFAAFLYSTRGSRALLRNRAERIALPLTCAWIILFPLVIVAVRWTFRGTYQGEAKLGFPSPGERCVAVTISTYRFVDGKIEDDWGVTAFWQTGNAWE